MWRFKMHTQIKSHGLPRQLRYCIPFQRTAKINLLATPILYDLLLLNMQERSSVLRKLNDLMLANKQDLGQIISLETVGGQLIL